MAPWQGSPIATSTSCPAAELACRTSTWRCAEGDGSFGDKPSNGEHASNSAADKFRPDMSQDIFQQDESLAHTVSKTKRRCQDNFPDLGEGYIRSGNSLDLLPIENLWAIIGDKVGKMNPATLKTTLIENFRSVRCCFSAEMLDNAMCGMPRRAEKCDESINK